MAINNKEKVEIITVIGTIIGIIASLIAIYSDTHSQKVDNNISTDIQVTTSQVEEVETEPTTITTTELVTTTEEITTTEKITEPPVTEPPCVYLADLEPTDSYNYWKTMEEIDNIGNTYYSDTSHFFCFAYGYDQGYAIYYLGKKYTKLSGTIAISHSSYRDETMVLSILNDEKNVIYESPSMDKFTTPIEISVDVTNIEWLTIQKKGYGVRPILNNWKLE